MIGKQFKTKYPSIVPKGIVGICTDIFEREVYALKIEFPNSETFWFMKRDLEEVS